MTRQYEAVYIFDSALDEATVTTHLEQFHSISWPIPTDDAPECAHWGKRTLAYPIKNHESGLLRHRQVRIGGGGVARVRARGQA